MSQTQTQYSTTTKGSESGSGSNNNVYQGPFEKSVSNDNYPNGMGIAQAASLKAFENVPGSEASEQYMLKEREMARFNSLKKAFGNQTINNAGIVLDTYGGAFGEGGTKPNIQGGANK